MGNTSADIISAPLFSNPSNGSPVSTLTPAKTSVLPNFTFAEPLALSIIPISISKSPYDRNFVHPIFFLWIEILAFVVCVIVQLLL